MNAANYFCSEKAIYTSNGLFHVLKALITFDCVITILIY
jgi:hypothetical protein